MGSELFGVDLFGDEIKPDAGGRLKERFIMPPFSVLNAREGGWQERKTMWVSLGLRSEAGRGESGDVETEPSLNFSSDPVKAAKMAPGGSIMPACDYSKKERGDGSGRALAQSYDNDMEKYGGARGNAYGTSIFDPVLCELLYTWFCPPRGLILDPFAGGSVRGIVAGFLGFKYHGIELSIGQIEANRAQMAEILRPDAQVAWEHGDSAVLLPAAPEADFILACPPYGDLERYSDDPRDLSTMDYADFYGAYKNIIELACARLKPDRFACFVIGDFRDKAGNYRGFVADTINIFRDAGLPLYNDAVLLTAVGSLPVRVSGQFDGSRKLGKTHQNVLVFTKGDGKKAFQR